ncbi:maleylacetate reductase [Lysobacter sp.]|uniref:maleylacetate reductase n=1 Tax=Lysobacter sp. TaxID=72226 RepID=UPI002D719683|nr:maleylacetate reductase [Lysobacter sp.]HZX77303.1 maleylacetate reductase [Lysobacter sp.]
MDHFVYQGLPSRVVFGWDSLQRLPEELDRLGMARALILTTPEQKALGEQVAALIGERAAGVLAEAVMHVPIEVARHARIESARRGADGCIAVGGGSTIGLGKAIAMESGLPILAIPTTYAGSEMTPVYGITESRLKKTGRDPRVLPRTVLYDPTFTLTLPTALSASSGMNAMAHAVEALYAQDGNPIVGLMAVDAIRALARSLPAIVDDPKDRAARSDALYGAWLAGTCLGSVGMALHHKLCHTLGGTFNLPHAAMHAVLLPYSAHYNHTVAPHALNAVASALGGEHASEAGPRLQALNYRLHLPTSLAAIGMPHSGIREAAELACANPYYNPRPFDPTSIEALLTAAWHGDRLA